MKMISFLAAAALFACTALFSADAAGKRSNDRVEVTGLGCNMQESPCWTGSDSVFLSWKLASDRNSVVQKAYRIQVASSEEALLSGKADRWDSGWVDSPATLHVRYAGGSLESRGEYFWRVRLKTSEGTTAWSDAAVWTVAPDEEAMLEAKWIGLDRCMEGEKADGGNTRLAARYFRKDFTTGSDAGVSKAVLYISGLGIYEAYINGRKVSDDVHSPAVSDYGKAVYYNIFDVTSLIKSASANTIAAAVGNGFFFAPRNPGLRHFGFPKLAARLEISYSDGTVQTILTDSSWMVSADGPVRENNYYDGEVYDARKEMPGWNTTGFMDRADVSIRSRWMPASEVSAPGGKFRAQPNPPVKVMHTLKPVSISEIAPGRYILDMGQNMVGRLAMRLDGESGQQVKLRFAELLNPDGSIYTANLRSALCTDVYIASGEGDTEWKPAFVFHGFRYVEITGYPGTPSVDDFTGEVIYDEMPMTGHFRTSDSTLNAIYRNATWGIRGNYHGMPTDCPQRDERLGWLGDRTTGSFGENYVFGNGLLYAKWLQDIEDSQNEAGAISDVSPNFWEIYNDDITWPSAYFNVARMLYERYGNPEPVIRHYSSMKKWIGHIAGTAMENGIVTKDTYGDWCMPPESPELIHSQDPARKTDGRLLSTATYYYLLRLMEKFAVISGNEADTSYFSSLASEVETAYNREFLHSDQASGNAWYGNNTVTGNLLSLAYGLVPDGLEESVFKHVVDKTVNEFDSHVSTGVIGICHLMRQLTRHGCADLAFKVATNTDYPSWGYMVERGATTIWELWNGDTADPAMNSANHVMLLGDLLIWFYEDLAGIKTAPGSIAFSRLEMKPYPVTGLDYVDASYDSARGLIKSSWKKSADGRFTWDIELPANTSAEIWLPAKSQDGLQIPENAVFLRSEPGYMVYSAGSGVWRFVSSL